MVIGFGDKIYHKYNYIYNIVGGLIFLVFSLVLCQDLEQIKMGDFSY
jgi:hypothetical protein